MKAIFIKKIETEIRELPDDFTETNYEKRVLENPETKEIKYYFVKVEDKEFLNDLVRVSYGFLNERIKKSVDNFKEDFYTFEVPKMKESWYEFGRESVRRFSFFKKLKYLFFPSNN